MRNTLYNVVRNFILSEFILRKRKYNRARINNLLLLIYTSIIITYFLIDNYYIYWYGYLDAFNDLSSPSSDDLYAINQ